MAMCEIVIKCGLFACIHGHDLFDFYFFQVSDKIFYRLLLRRLVTQAT